MPSSSRSTVVTETPIHPDASCAGGRRRSGFSSSKHHEPSRSGSTRRSESSSSKHHEPSRSSSTRDGRSDKKFDGHRGTITRLGTSKMLPAISETPEKITSVPRFTDEGVDRTKTRSSRHHADDRTETRSSRHHGDDRTVTRSRRPHGDQRTKASGRLTHSDDRTMTRSSRSHADDNLKSWGTDSQVTIRPSDTVSQASSCYTYTGALLPYETSRYEHSRSLASQNTYESRPSTTVREKTITRTSSHRGDSSSQRSSSTRERELEKKIERLEDEKARALERKVEDLERKLENMHVENAIERRAMRNAYYQKESKKINDYALSFDGEAYYLQLLNRVNPSRYVYL